MPSCPEVPVSRVAAWLGARLAAYSAEVREVEAVQMVVMVGFDSIGSVAAVYTAPVVLAISAVEAVAAWSRPRGSPRRCAVQCGVYTCPCPSYS
jgi:hypothetical protein